MSAIESLRARTAELIDLSGVEMLLGWDQLVMMPHDGGAARAEQLATLARVYHERATARELGELLDELADAPLGPIDADIVRVARRDYERVRRVPEQLAAERAGAAVEGQEIWQAARANDDFASFAPALERNVRLAREYGRAVAEEGQSTYDALLADYDWGLSSAQLRELFGVLGEALPPLAREAQERSPRRALEVPVAAQRAAVSATLARLGVSSESWRVDVSAHPFTAWIGRGDTRVTTRYGDGNVESLLSSLHEYGHALYERQVDPALARTVLGQGTSMSVHESQSKLWENHVARNAAFAQVLARGLAEGGFEVQASELNAAMVGVQATLIRVSADPLTYPLHIIMRFELERALVEGELEVAELPAAWREATERLLGLRVPTDAEGVLQDVHWSGGSFGYFPSYALGVLIAAQLWETLTAQLGPQDEALGRGDASAIQRWLGENVHRFGRRLDTRELVERATGAPLATDAFLRYVEPLARGR